MNPCSPCWRWSPNRWIPASDNEPYKRTPTTTLTTNPDRQTLTTSPDGEPLRRTPDDRSQPLAVVRYPVQRVARFTRVVDPEIYSPTAGRAQAAACPLGFECVTTYYSDSTHTTVVGGKLEYCDGGSSSWGSRTGYLDHYRSAR
jgi:uncharacterized protein DUF6289